MSKLKTIWSNVKEFLVNLKRSYSIKKYEIWIDFFITLGIATTFFFVIWTIVKLICWIL